jgi:hypothetical protein
MLPKSHWVSQRHHIIDYNVWSHNMARGKSLKDNTIRSDNITEDTIYNFIIEVLMRAVMTVITTKIHNHLSVILFPYTYIICKYIFCVLVACAYSHHHHDGLVFSEIGHYWPVPVSVIHEPLHWFALIAYASWCIFCQYIWYAYIYVIQNYI